MEGSLEASAKERPQTLDCGVADYRAILGLQLDLHAKRLAGQIADTVLICEHPPVITLGAHRSANRLLASPLAISSQGIDLVEVSRGGGATAHNPGQLVVYPIIDLRKRGISAGQYVRTLEALGMELLSILGLQVQVRNALPGLWVDQRKIASIGVRISRGVSFHGMAVNIQNDLRIFDLLVPCGLDGVHVTSLLKETGQTCAMALVKEKAAELLIRYLTS
jgi:lipoate-protein ligase B